MLGSFDDLSRMADVCQKHKIWMHVDVSASDSFTIHEEMRNTVVLSPLSYHDVMAVAKIPLLPID